MGRQELKIEKVYKTKKNPRSSKVLGEALFLVYAAFLNIISLIIVLF